jgi:hypothetical protein
MKPGQTEIVPSNPPVIPPANGDIPMTGIGSIVTLTLLLALVRSILDQPPTKQ